MSESSRVEKFTINNPVRSYFQRTFRISFLLAGLELAPPARILELGCGRCEATLSIAKYFPEADITATDFDDDMISKATAFLKHPPAWAGNVDIKKIHICRADAANLDYGDGIFDAVVAFGVLHHVEDWKKAVREMHRVLKPGGKVVIDETLARFFRLSLVKTILPPAVLIEEADLKDYFESTGFHIACYKTYFFRMGLLCVATRS